MEQGGRECREAQIGKRERVDRWVWVEMFDWAECIIIEWTVLQENPWKRFWQMEAEPKIRRQ